MPKPKRHVFTSESVTEGHPDKVADQISDAVLDAILAKDPARPRRVRNAGDHRHGGGRGRDHHHRPTSHIPDIVRKTVEGIGYTDASYGFDGRTCAVLTVDRPAVARHRAGASTGKSKEQGAGDQGMMFGYACPGNPGADAAADRAGAPAGRAPRRGAQGERRGHRLAPARRQEPGDRSNTRATARWRVDTVVLSTQHAERVGRRELSQNTIKATMVIGSHPSRCWRSSASNSRRTKFLVNPTGRFVIGGPHGDAGLTGRKIIVDTYGGMARHGGGAFSGKDPSKVDRSAAYVAARSRRTSSRPGWRDRCEVQLAYAIGVRRAGVHPGGHVRHRDVPDARLEQIVREVLRSHAQGHHRRAATQAADLPGHRGLRAFRTAAQEGRGPGQRVQLFPWEETSRVRALLTAARV